MNDIFRPRREPARSIYDALQREAQHRKGRGVDEWLQKERTAVWMAARDYAQMHGMLVPTIDQVRRAENCACGHTDYGAKWAYGVAELLIATTPGGAA